MARLVQRLGLTRYEADEHYKQALDAYKKHNMDAAILAMEQALELLPGNAEYLAAKGFFYLEDGVLEKAMDDFEDAIKLHPYETLAHFGLGIVAYQTKRWDEALQHFTDAYRSDPDRAETFYYLALVHHRKAENKQALAYMQQAHSLFEAADDRRRNDANRWIRQLEKMAQDDS